MCFCRDSPSKYGIHYHLYKQWNKGYDYTSFNTSTVKEDVKICRPYISDFFKEQSLNKGVAALIVFINIVIRLVVIKVMHNVGFSTESN
jgi:hypothetical protein